MTLLSGFLDSAGRHGDRPALEVEGRAVSYDELHREASSLATVIAEHAPEGPPLCAVLASRSRTAFTGVVATLLSGRGFVPLNPKFPTDRNRVMLERSGSTVVIVDEASAGQLAALLDGVERDVLVIAPDIADVDALAARLSGVRVFGPQHLPDVAPIPGPAVDPEAVAYLLFTSGSTGAPKGVGVTHRNVRAFLDHVLRLYDVQPTDRLSQMFDMTFDLSVFDMFVAWERGACVCCPPDTAKPDRFIRDASLTVWFSVPSAAIVMQRLGMLKPGRYPTLRLSLFCGEPLPETVAAAWAAAAPDSVVENLYGPTELTIACTRYRWSADSAREGERGLVPIGWAFDDMEHLIVDEGLRPVALGEAGELIMTGPQMTPGYWRDPAKTDERFVVPPGADRRYYRTGDRVRQAGEDGPLLFLGRVDQQIKVRGHRVELGEIEAAVRDELGLQGVVALGWPITAAGVSGVEVFVEGAGIDVAEVPRRVASRLPEYMVPRRVHVLERLPLNANGKYDRNALLRELETRR